MTTDCHWNCVHQIVYITANNNLRKKVKNDIFASTCNVLEEKVKAKLTFVLLRMTSTYLGMYFRSINSRASTCTFWRALEWTFFCDFRLIFRGQRYFVAICVIVSDLCSYQVWLTFMPFLSRFSLSSQQCSVVIRVLPFLAGSQPQAIGFRFVCMSESLTKQD